MADTSMTDHAPLTDEELAEWSQYHVAASAQRQICRVCGRRWPCAPARLIAEVGRLRELADFARLLGPARMVLDRCAMLAPGFQAEAGDMAQRIVDLIGHPVTDEPPHALVERDELRAEVERLQRTLNRTRFVADHWRVGVLSGDICGTNAFASHSLCMVLAALDGETDPTELGLLPGAQEGFRAL